MSKYHCKCGGLILPDFDSFKVGDEVNCMLETRKPIGNDLVSINQKAFIGKIIYISGDEFSIKSKIRYMNSIEESFLQSMHQGQLNIFELVSVVVN